MQNAKTARPPPLPPIELFRPLANLKQPAARHQHARNNIHQPNEQRGQTTPLLGNRQQDGLDVEFHENARHVVLRDRVALLRDGVLVREDGVSAVAVRMLGQAVGAGRGRFVVPVDFAQGFGVGGVDGGHDGEVVLVFVEAVVGGGEGVVEGVAQRRVEGAEGEFVNVVGEVEGCAGS